LTISKKVISAVTSAALVASLLATVGASTVLAAGPYGTAVVYNASATTVPADGASTIVLTFNAYGTAVNNVTISTTNGKFTSTSAGSGIVIGATQTIATVTNPASLAAASTLTLTAPAAAGTANVTVQLTPVAGGTALTDSITTFTFTAATGIAVSSAYSTTTLSASSTPAGAGLSVVTVTTNVRDGNNVAIAAGASVTWTITGPAYFSLGGSYTQTVTANPAISSTITSTGVAGPATITTKIKYLGVETALPDKVLTFVGVPAKIVLSNGAYSLDRDAAAPADNDALFAEVTDAAGQIISAGVAFTAGVYTPANIFNVNLGSAVYDTVDKGWYIDADCAQTGSATVTLKATVGTTTVTSAEAVKLTCANAITAAKPGTLELAAGATSVAANSSVPILVTIKDVNGLPAPDGTVVTAVTNGVGTVFSSKGLSTKGTVDGVSKFTYFAPANSGSGTVTVFATNTVPTSKSVTLLIGPTGSGVAVGQVESALGVTTTGPWSKSTKVAKVGEFITFKINAGSANAGKTVGIFIQTKDANGVWSAPVRFTARVADSKGIAFFNWRGTKAMWISLKGGMGDVGQSNPIQARWQ
jgi:hypothetical protein